MFTKPNSGEPDILWWFFFQLSFMMTFIVSFKFSDEIFRHFRLSLLRYKDQWLVMSTFNDPGVRHFKLIALTNTYLDHFLILQIEESRSMLTLEKKVVITSCFSRDSMQWISYPHCVRDHVPGNTAFNCLNTTLQVQYKISTKWPLVYSPYFTR